MRAYLAKYSIQPSLSIISNRAIISAMNLFNWLSKGVYKLY